MMIHNLLAMGAPAGDTQPDPKAQMIQMIAMFAILGVMFYFLMITKFLFLHFLYML